MRYLESAINFKTNSGIMIKEALQNKDTSLIKIKNMTI